MKRSKNGDKCKNEIKSAKNYRDEVPAIVDELVASCSRGGCFDHVSAEPIPHREAIIDILHRLALILYPGYFIRTRLDSNQSGILSRPAGDRSLRNAFRTDHSGHSS